MLHVAATKLASYCLVWVVDVALSSTGITSQRLSVRSVAMLTIHRHPGIVSVTSSLQTVRNSMNVSVTQAIMCVSLFYSSPHLSVCLFFCVLRMIACLKVVVQY